MTTLRPTASLWRRTRATLLAGSIALGTLLAPAVTLADSSEPAVGGTTGGYTWTGDSLVDATAYVVANGGLELRATPSATATVLVTIPNGTLVDLRIDETDTVVASDGVTRWWPVAWDGHSGWVSGLYLSDQPGSTTRTAASTSTASGPFEWTGDTLEGATATAAGGGSRVNVRAEPSTGSAIVTKVDDGALVNLRIDRADTVVDGGTRWWPVEVNGQPGWISGDYLTNSNAAVFPAGATAMAQTPSGRGLKLRAGAGRDAEQIGSVPEGATVTIVSGPASHDNSANGWFEIDFGGKRGYVDGDLLVLLTMPATAASSSTTTTTSGTQSHTSQTTQESTNTANTAAPTQGTTPAATTPAAQGTTPVAGETPTTAANQPTPTPTQAAQQAGQGDDADAEATRPWDTTTPTPTATAATTPTSTPAQQVSSAGFIRPVNGAVQTQGFGCSSLGFYAYNPDWGCAVHDGLDLAAPSYTPILAVADATVVTAGWCDCGLGYYVELDHGGGLHTLYGHMASQPYVAAGQKVTQGQEIGPVGSTGLSTGPHTHFMVQVNGVSQDPARYLP